MKTVDRTLAKSFKSEEMNVKGNENVKICFLSFIFRFEKLTSTIHNQQNFFVTMIISFDRISALTKMLSLLRRWNPLKSSLISFTFYQAFARLRWDYPQNEKAGEVFRK